MDRQEKLMKELDTSITVRLLRNIFYRRYTHLEKRLQDIYKDSQTHKLMTGFWEKIAICFRYSFLGRITEIKEEGSSVLLDNSRAVQYWIRIFRIGKNKIIYYLNTSKVAKLTKMMKGEFYSFPVKIISTIVVIAIIVNVVLSIILGRGITLWGWAMRGVLLLVGIGGLFCEADWQTVIGNSITFRHVNRRDN